MHVRQCMPFQPIRCRACVRVPGNKAEKAQNQGYNCKEQCKPANQCMWLLIASQAVAEVGHHLPKQQTLIGMRSRLYIPDPQMNEWVGG